MKKIFVSTIIVLLMCSNVFAKVNWYDFILGLACIGYGYTNNNEIDSLNKDRDICSENKAYADGGCAYYYEKYREYDTYATIDYTYYNIYGGSFYYDWYIYDYNQSVYYLNLLNREADRYDNYSTQLNTIDKNISKKEGARDTAYAIGGVILLKSIIFPESKILNFSKAKSIPKIKCVASNGRICLLASVKY